MKGLQNNFPLEVRLLYLDIHECWICGQNGTQTGGLEIHHITGRKDPDADSAFNSSCLCKKCHDRMCHSQEEEQNLFAITFKWLYHILYKPLEGDLRFIERNYQRLFTIKLNQWLEAPPPKSR